MSTGKPLTYDNWNAGEPNNFRLVVGILPFMNRAELFDWIRTFLNGSLPFFSFLNRSGLFKTSWSREPTKFVLFQTLTWKRKKFANNVLSTCLLLFMWSFLSRLKIPVQIPIVRIHNTGFNQKIKLDKNPLSNLSLFSFTCY